MDIFPMELLFFAAYIIAILSLIGIFIFRSQKDKILMILPLLAQIIIIGVFFGVIKHLQNLLLICSLVTSIDLLVYLFVRNDRNKDYMYYALHFVSIIQLLDIVGIIA